MNKVKVLCYGDVRKLERDTAIKTFKEYARNCRGSERERYINVLQDLEDGLDIAWDRVDVPKGYHVCKHCGNLTVGVDEDVLCGDCMRCFGHALFSELKEV